MQLESGTTGTDVGDSPMSVGDPFVALNPTSENPSTAMDKSRIEFLQEALEANPDDTFARYALAVELSTCNRPAEAWPHFEYLLHHHPDYSATYFQAGKFLVQQDRRDAARQVFAKGIEVAQRQGNRHTESELQAALESLGDSGS